MHKWLIGLLRWVDVRIIYVFTAIFILPFCMLIKTRVNYRYFRRQQKYGVFHSIGAMYMNYYYFSQVVIDRFAMYAGRKFNIETVGYEHYELLAKQPEGFIQLSSHVGNYEIAGYTLVAKDKPFNALVFFGEKESVMQGRSSRFADTNIRMIPVSNDMSHIFLIEEALANGETVSMPADRILGSKKTIELPFLNGVADFPIGPFRVATMRGLDVLAVNVMKTSMTSYKIYVTPLTYDHSLPRNEQIKALAEAYVKELERMMKLYPTQWYNYFDFWK
ncbi:MAG: lysophospholipid acyltransferase family protein [Prevotella sp.]|nr:lysophospholipid acyltransferase family protein [Prevotella sp.]